MKTLHQLSRQYRQQLAHKKKLRDQVLDLKIKVDDINRAIEQLNRQLASTKVLIDYCVVTGESPAEAILRNTHEQIQQTVIDIRGYDYSTNEYLQAGNVKVNNGLSHQSITVTPMSTLLNTGVYLDSSGVGGSIMGSSLPGV